MPRPRADQEGPTAQERLEEAFWELLEKKTFSGLTVKGIANRAGVNHNTFYYYYENIEDMADKVFLYNVPVGLIDVLMTMILEGHLNTARLNVDADMELRYHRVRLFLMVGSSEMALRVRNTALHAWFERLGIREEELTENDRARITFLWGGIAALMSSDQAKTVESYFAALEQGIIDAATTLVRHVAADHGKTFGA